MADKPQAVQSSPKIEATKRFNALQMSFSGWIPALNDLSRYIDPTRGIFNGNRSKIGKMIDHQTLVDSHATFSKRITASGMQTGMTDPSRPWFKLSLEQFILDNVPGAREWLDEVTRRMLEIMNKSNIYTVFQHCYDELVTFGTGCFLILEDFEDVVRGRSFTAGEYYLGVDNKGRINAFAREYDMTVGQMAKEFGYESLSPSAKVQYDNNQLDAIFKVRHLIEENKTRIVGMNDFTNMPFRSWYWEAGTNTGEEFLGKRGFPYFPVVAPRWDTVTTEQVNGYGPGWHAIGDIKQLQVTVQDKLLAEEKLHNPPVVEDANVVGHSNRLPGGVTKSSSSVPNSGVRAAYQVDPQIAAFNDSIDRLHNVIDKHFFADVFRMISNLEGQPNVTAYQIAQMKQEQMMLLGPILQNSNKEMHSVAIDMIYAIMNDAGLIPEPPEGLEGVEVKVQFVSILAQAQKLAGVQQIEHTLMTIGTLAQMYPGITDTIDVVEAGISIAEGNGIEGKIINDKQKIAEISQQRAEMQQKQMALQAGTEIADAASKLGKTPMNGGPQSVLDGLAQAGQAQR